MIGYNLKIKGQRNLPLKLSLSNKYNFIALPKVNIVFKLNALGIFWNFKIYRSF